MFGNYGDASLDINSGRLGPFRGITIAQSLAWAFATGDSPETRVVPYLALSEELTELDWAALVEYLGVPYDPELDSPDTKPHAFRRFQQRSGDGTPWTDEFREVLLELGNETWHNGAGGYGWHGFGRPGWVHHGGLEYGLFARYLFDEQLTALPAWTEHRLGERLKLVLGANYQWAPDAGYGELAVQQSSSVSYLGHANYVGPKWETDDPSASVFDDHGVQETLVGLPTGMAELIQGAAASRAQLNAEAGTSYRLIAYEGGPSGYWSNSDDPEVDELYGKSLAMGVAALDTWLYSSLHGFGHQCYLGFASGRWWSSHTLPEAGGFRAHPGWLALRLRNRHAPGDELLHVGLDNTPRYTRAEASVDLLAAYALSDAAAGVVSVFVLSRKLDGAHDGVDFGDGHTPVTLHLPFERQPASIMLHRLAHPDGSPADPRANNREQLSVDIVSEAIDVSHYAPDFTIDERTGGSGAGMPPGTVYLYVFGF